jgi:hypothetical protein
VGKDPRRALSGPQTRPGGAGGALGQARAASGLPRNHLPVWPPNTPSGQPTSEEDMQLMILPNGKALKSQIPGKRLEG